MIAEDWNCSRISKTIVVPFQKYCSQTKYSVARTLASTFSTGLSCPHLGIEEMVPASALPVSPRQEIFEDCPLMIEIVSPSAPVCDVDNSPTQFEVEVLASTPTKRMCAIRVRVDADVDEIIAEATEE